MKKIFITASALLAVMAMNASVFNTGKMTKVEGAVAEKPVISADGSFVVSQNNVKGGIEKINLADGSSSVVAQGKGLYHLALSPDGSTVAFTRPTFNDQHLKLTSIEAVDMNTGKLQTIVKAGRQVSSGLTLTNNGVTAVNKGRQATKAVSGKAQAAPVVAIDHGHLTLTVNGKTTVLDPQGRGSYLWPSLSPDGTKIVYWLVYRGCFVCDLDGSNARPMGGIRAAVWAGNDALVGVESTDDTAQIPETSVLVAVDINSGERQTLTDKSILAQFPSVNADATRMAFSDMEGNLYYMDLSK